MNRLTKISQQWRRPHLSACLESGNECEEDCLNCNRLGEAITKLYEYEDTGLEPKQVVALRKRASIAALRKRVYIAERALCLLAVASSGINAGKVQDKYMELAEKDWVD